MPQTQTLDELKEQLQVGKAHGVFTDETVAVVLAARAKTDAQVGVKEEMHSDYESDFARALASERDKSPMNDALRKEIKEIGPAKVAAHIARVIARGRGNSESAYRWAKTTYGESHVVCKVLSAGVAADGGFVLRDEFSEDIIEIFRPQSAVMRHNPIRISMGAASFTIPKLTAGSAATYVGENANIGLTQPAFGEVKLNYKKLAALIPFSNDMLRMAQSNIESLIIRDLAMAMSQEMDTKFLRGLGTEFTPRGLLNWTLAANVITAQASPTLVKVTEDSSDAILLLLNNDIPMINPGWIFAPRTALYLQTLRDSNGNFAFRPEMLPPSQFSGTGTTAVTPATTGTYFGYPYVTSTKVPINLGGSSNESEIYLVDFADVVVGEGLGLQLDSSNEAAYFDGTSVQASFSRDQSVVRAIMEHDLVVRHRESLVMIDTVKWGV